MGVVSAIAESVGSPEAGIRLTITLFAGYPISWLYRAHLFRLEKEIQHAALTVFGVAMLFFNFGFDVLHSAVAILVAWFLCNFMAGTIHSVVIAFVGFMGHLLWGYWVTESAVYDIFWTMPHCILTLRLIGLVWDVYDGKRPEAELSAEQKETAIKEPPSLLETFAFSYFFGSALVGPQLPLSRFRSWINGEYADPKTGGPPDTLMDAGKRLGMGVLFLLLHLGLTPYFPDSQFYQPFWLNANLLMKHVYTICWYRLLLLRYQSVWLFTEGICIYIGLSHNGVDENGVVQWDGLRNIRITVFETGCSFSSIVESFNINTNKWAAKYVFKRLKFLGNKNMSQVLTLLFLAIWHGWHLGYFVCFFGEFLTVNGEKELVGLVARNEKLNNLLRGPLKILTWIVCKTVMTLGSSFFFLSFGLIKKEKWIPVYNGLYWDGFLAFMLLWPVAFRLLKPLFPRPHKPKDQ